MSSVIANEDLAVVGVTTHSDKDNDTATMRFTVEVRDAEQMEHIRYKLSQLPGVIEVRQRKLRSLIAATRCRASP